MPKIEVVRASSKRSLMIVQRLLREFNARVWEKFNDSETAERELNLVAKVSGKIVGGLIANTRLKWLKISIMAVEEDRRRNGIGTLLVQRAELEAQKRGCLFSYVDTMSYQAPDFYRKRGYVESGRLANWDSHGHDKVFFVKHFSDEPPAMKKPQA